MGLFTIPLYFDYKSAYSHLAKAEAYRLEKARASEEAPRPAVETARGVVENLVASATKVKFRRTRKSPAQQISSVSLVRGPTDEPFPSSHG